MDELAKFGHQLEVTMADLQPIDIEGVLPFDLASEYWSPSEPGDNRLIRFYGFEVKAWPSVNDPQVLVDLECVKMLWPDGGKFLYNASTRLKGYIRDYVATFSPPQKSLKTSLLIQYEGKTPNKSNSFKSAEWKVRPVLEGGNHGA